jgi:hypothetical protein
MHLPLPRLPSDGMGVMAILGFVLESCRRPRRLTPPVVRSRSPPCLGLDPLPVSVSIPSLSRSVTRDLLERTLCPVRALRFYVDWTKDPVFRRGRKRLFVSIVEGFEREIRLATVARWIVSTIQLAYSLTQDAKCQSPPMWCVHCLPPGQLMRESPSGTCSKQQRGVITPRSLSSTCMTVPFWPTACVQSVQSSQPSMWCDRGRRRSPLLGGHSVRPSILCHHGGPTSLTLSVFLTVRLSGSPLGLEGSVELPRMAPMWGCGPGTLSLFWLPGYPSS